MDQPRKIQIVGGEDRSAVTVLPIHILFKGGLFYKGLKSGPFSKRAPLGETSDRTSKGRRVMSQLEHGIAGPPSSATEERCSDAKLHPMGFTSPRLKTIASCGISCHWRLLWISTIELLNSSLNGEISNLFMADKYMPSRH